MQTDDRFTIPRHVDVVVIGGGAAGIVAAVQAARAGADTLLVEKTGMLGGTMTMGGIPYPGLFYAWGEQVIAGIGWELVNRCLSTCGDTVPDTIRDPAQHWMGHVKLNGAVIPAVCDEMVLDAGVRLLFHTMLAGVYGDDAGWQVTLCTKTGLTTVTAAVLIDATGDANAIGLAGYALRIPDDCQPATLCCRMTGCDWQALDLDAVNRAFEQEVQAGRCAYTDASWNTQGPDIGRWLRSGGSNANHIHHINARDSEGKTRLEVEARKSVLRLYRFLRTQPGLEHLRLEYLSPECGVRETVTIVGEATVTADDYASGRCWDDAVCNAFYPIDLHTSETSGLDCRALQRGTVPTVPRGALLPAGSRNLLAAGRCLSSDRLANSALRVQATSMATGQAAGAMAALGVQTGIEVSALPLEQIHALLGEHGAILPASMLAGRDHK